MSCGGRTAGALVEALPPSRERVAAGVRGGECTADDGGEGLGEASTDVPPEVINFLVDAAEVEGTCSRRNVVSSRTHDHGISHRMDIVEVRRCMCLLVILAASPGGRAAQTHDVACATTGCYHCSVACCVAVPTLAAHPDSDRRAVVDPVGPAACL